MSAQANEWRLYVCSDCDTDDGAVIMQERRDADREASCALEHCPACGSYLSLLNVGAVEVRGNPLIHLRMRTPSESE